MVVVGQTASRPTGRRQQDGTYSVASCAEHGSLHVAAPTPRSIPLVEDATSYRGAQRGRGDVIGAPYRAGSVPVANLPSTSLQPAYQRHHH